MRASWSRVMADRKTRKVVARRPVSIRAKYDAAQSSADNRRHWANADALDAVRANNAAVRARLRRNSRYEIANNCYARGISLTLANDLVGAGPQLQMLLDDSDLNDRIEHEFTAWSKQIDLAGKLRTMRIAKIQDGEAFAMLISNPALWPVTLDIRLIEADQVDTPSGQDGRYVEGIRYDNYGNPAAYALLKSHPGGLRFDTGFDEVPQSHMLHWYRVDRPGQIRGVPEITPALPLFAHLRRYTLSVVVAAELAAEWTLFMTTNSPPNGEAAAMPNDFEEIEFERGLMTNLPEGWAPHQLEPKQPTTTYAEFKSEILNEIARCLNLPYNIAACNSSGYNYASGRLDHQTYFRSIAVEQAHLEERVLDRVLREWLDEASKEFNWSLENAPHQWFWTGRDHVDPAKEANAQATRLTNNTTTLATEYARQGKDWETELRQRAKELAMMKSLGIPTGENPKQEREEDEENVAKKDEAD